jgi:hypothetical protein
VLCLLLISAPSCGGSPATSGDTGRIEVALAMTGAPPDVATIAFKVVRSADTCAAAAVAGASVPLSAGPPASSQSGADAGAAHLYAQAVLVLMPGTYRLCATPTTSAGTASTACTAAEALATVAAGQTASATMLSQCTGPARGGAAPSVVLNDAPVITAIAVKDGAVPTTCGPVTITAAASDPEGDAVTLSWAVTSGPGAASLTSVGASVSFQTTTAGQYGLQLTATDALGAATSLTFPLSVVAKASCP